MSFSPPDLEGKSGLAAIQVLMQRYPALWAQFKDHPDVLNLLGQAQGWPPDRFQQALQNTTYWKTRTEEQRNWDSLSAVDPAEAQKRMQDAVTMIKSIGARLGLSDRSGDKNVQSADFLHDVYTLSSQSMTEQQAEDYLTSKYWQQDINRASGDIAANLGTIRGLQADYALPHSPQTAYDMAIKMSTGHITQDTVKGNLASQAALLYGGEVSNAIRQGKTVREWADPYISLAAQNLEIGADQVDLSDPKWQAFLQSPANPAKPGQSNQPGTRPMTLAEWQATIRTDPAYGYSKTSNAKQSASQLATTLQQKFGASG